MSQSLQGHFWINNVGKRPSSFHLHPELICATALHTQIPLGEQVSQDADMPVNTGKSMTSALRNPPEALKTQKLRTSLGHDPSKFPPVPGTDLVL